jgi:hypothetical protein
VNTSRARAALVIGAIVAGSAVAGAGIDHWVTRNSRPRRPPPGSARPEEAAKHRAEVLDRMTKDLSLSPNQRAGIDSVMQRTDSALRVVRSEMQPRLRQIFDASRAEISARLDSAQRVKFAKEPPKRRRGQ